MPNEKKRKPDLRRIRPSKTYRLPEVAATLDRDIATVRRWIAAGLPVLDGSKPTLVDGAELRSWLKDYWEARKRKCAPNELYCLKCRVPRHPSAGSVSIEPRNEKTVTIKAVCSECGTKMNQAGSLRKLLEVEIRFRTFMQNIQRLTGCEDTSVKHTLCADRPSVLKPMVGRGQISMDFEPQVPVSNAMDKPSQSHFSTDGV